MKKNRITLNGNLVLVFDAPEETTHTQLAVHDGLNLIFYKKLKQLDIIAIDESKSDSGLIEQYENRVVNVGKLNNAPIGMVDDLFNVVKNGNFYDYVHNGIFYSSAISALKEVISQEFGYSNPYLVIIKPF